MRSLDPAIFHDPDETSAADERRVALAYLSEAFAEARLDGVDGDCLAQAALFAAFAELVETYGEEAVASFTERLPTRVRSGEFTIPGVRQ